MVLSRRRVYFWEGDKCRDFWSTSYTSFRRLRGVDVGEPRYWSSRREVTVTTISYRRTAIHGLTPEECRSIIEKTGKHVPDSSWHTRDRGQGKVDLFHIKRIRVNKMQYLEGVK